MRVLLCVFLLIWTTTGELGRHVRKNSASNYISTPSNLIRFPISVDKNGVGYSMFGYHTGSGVAGGWLAENGSPGGPHAEATTPFGLGAGAGVGIRYEHGTSTKVPKSLSIFGVQTASAASTSSSSLQDHRGLAIEYAYAYAQVGPMFVGICGLIYSDTNIKIWLFPTCIEKFNLLGDQQLA